MSWRNPPRGVSAGLGLLTAVLAIVTFVMRLSLAESKRQQAEDTRRGAQILRDTLARLSATPVADPTKVAPAPGAGTDGWVVDDLDVWCVGTVWGGEATVHATKAQFERLTFDVTLYDGKKVVGHLHGRHDGIAVLDKGSVTLSSADTCSAAKPTGYKYEVS